MPHPAVVPLLVAHHKARSLDAWGVGLGAFASWVGVPGPGEAALVTAGVLGARHHLDMTTVFLFAWLGATLGGVAGWAIGRTVGRAPLLAPGPFLHTRERALQRGEQLASRSGLLVILVAPSWVIGILRLSALRFLILNALSAALWVAVLGFGSQIVGPSVTGLWHEVGRIALAAAVAVAGIVFLLTRMGLRRRSKRVPSEAPSRVSPPERHERTDTQ